MYALIIVIAMEQVGGTSVAATSQIIGKFNSLDECKAAASGQSASGAIADLSLTRGAYWHCAYAGPS